LLRLQPRPGEIPEYRRVDTNVVSAQERPTGATYDRFGGLVKFFADREYD
jgi:hypothetical protein